MYNRFFSEPKKVLTKSQSKKALDKLYKKQAYLTDKLSNPKLIGIHKNILKALDFNLKKQALIKAITIRGVLV